MPEEDNTGYVCSDCWDPVGDEERVLCHRCSKNEEDRKRKLRKSWIVLIIWLVVVTSLAVYSAK